VLADQHIPLGDRAGPPPGARYLTAAPITHAAGTKVLPVLSRGGTFHLRPGASVTAEELIRHVRQRKGAVQAPKAIRIVDALPTTSVGKIDKRALRTAWTG
jgi:acyl-coenzyme A synthetase/AMP-(fatty) acid ligase